jgi:hypothetical protein
LGSRLSMNAACKISSNCLQQQDYKGEMADT